MRRCTAGVDLKIRAQVICEKMNTPTVSISCFTYNQAPYIRGCIEGFLMQKTDFDFEVLIHDDASTDGTTEIIKEYADKNPNLIIPILQTENQYSQGIEFPFTFVFSRARGKYIALCEGDDYWTDENKLQVQVQAMQRHPQCNISFHPANMVSSDTCQKIQVLGKIYNNSRIISAKEILDRGISFMPTCSLMFKKSFLNNNEIITPLAKYSCSFFMKFLPAIDGGCLYINQTMSSYRFMSIGSWSQRVKDNPEVALGILRVIDEFDIYNEITQLRFSPEIRRIQSNQLFGLLSSKRLTSSKQKSIYLKYKGLLSPRQKIYLFLPFLYFSINRVLAFCRKLKRLAKHYKLSINYKLDRHLLK